MQKVRQDRIQILKENSLFSTGQVFQPKSCLFYVTMACNLHCPMCFQRKHFQRQKELSLIEIQEIFSPLSLDSVFLVGGEIFVRKDIYEILQFFDQKGCEISILTNGTLIDERGIEQLKTLPNLKNIWFSLDGLAATHDMVRGPGTFAKVEKVIRALADEKDIYINTVLLKENMNELVELYQYLQSLRVKQVTFQFKMAYTQQQYDNTCTQTGAWGYSNLVKDDCVESSLDLKYIKELAQLIPELLVKEGSTKIEFFPEIFVNHLAEYMEGTIREGHALLCKDFIQPQLKIDAQGNLILCEAMDYSPGNLKDNDLATLWNAEEFRTMRKRLSQVNLVEMCSRCCSLDLRKSKSL